MNDSTDTLLSHHENGIATLTINRPQALNALDPLTVGRLRACLKDAEADPEVNVVVIRGAGRAFSAGLDLSHVDSDAEIRLGDVLQFHFEPLLDTLRNLQVPVISVVHGAAAGVSAAIALASDLCFAAESGYFLLPFTGLGLLPDGGLTWLLPRLVGAQRAAAMALLGDRLPAATAANWGLCWRCVPDAELDAAVDETAKRLVALPRAGLVATKRALRESAGVGYTEHLLHERAAQHALGATEDFRARLKAFQARGRK